MHRITTHPQFNVLSGGFIECLDEPWHVGVCIASSPGSLCGNEMCVGGELCGWQMRAWSPLFLLSQLSSDFTGIRILFVILRVVDVVCMTEQIVELYTYMHVARSVALTR